MKLTLPRPFVSYLEGSSLIAGEDTGYPGGPDALAAYHDAEGNGRGGWTLTFDNPAVLDCLDDYAEVCEISARDARGDYRSSELDYRVYSNEIAAARAVRARIAKLR